MSVILGINTYHAGSSASIVIDGVPVVALPEERLNRVKYYAGFPKLAIAACLEIAGLKFSDIDAVAVGRDSSANLHKKLEFALRHPTKLLNLARMRKKSKTFDDMKSLIAAECDVDPSTLKFTTHNVEHHLAHTASAYFISEWDKCAGITIDGSGDFVSCLLSDCEGDEIRPLKKIFVPHSLGTLYTAVCQFIGYPKYGDEGKVMGLAPLGTDRYHDFFEGMLKQTSDGFELNPDYFLPFGANQGMEINDAGEMVVHRLYSDLFIKELGEPREKYGEITQRDEDVSFGLQRIFERYYMHMLMTLHKLVPTEKVAMAGGCALNSVANGKLLLETPFRETCIQPAAGDDGLAIGSALYVSNSILKEGKRWVMKNAYLGNEFSDAIIKAELERYKISYTQLDREQLLDTTSEEIKNGNVIGWFQGRMEWGPRALGNRSILAHPGFPNMKDILNARIKHREWFRPFAPSVLQERQTDLFEQDHPSPFMLHVYKIRPEWRERLSAVNHVDDTGRLQTVARDENPLYYDLIKTFEAKTGIPVILNTSFNENEPIVCQPSEAIECFLRTKMDVLVIGSFFCKKDDCRISSPPCLGGELLHMTWTVAEIPELRGFTVEWAEDGNYLLSRLNVIYRSSDLKPPFERIATINAPGWKAIVSNFRVAQRLFRFMVTNVVPLENGEIFVTFDKSVGVIRNARYRELERLARPCRVLRSACAIDGNGDIYFGEYLANDERGPMRVYRYKTGSNEVDVPYYFPAGSIKHIHGIYFDPYTSSLICLTGDDESECKMLKTSDGFQSVEVVGEGDETWRAVSMLFDDRASYYGMDAEFRSNHIYRIDRGTGERKSLGEVNGTVFYSKRLGDDLFFATTAENAPSQKENVAAIWHVSPGLKLSEVVKFQKDQWHRTLFMFGTIHFPYANKLTDELYFSLVGVKEDNQTFKITRA